MIRNKKVKAALLCILLAIFVTLFPISLKMLAGNNTVTASAAVTNNTLINVELANGDYVAYNNVTTVGGLKKNLIVKGTTNGNQEFTENDTYTLFDDEYDIKIKGELKADSEVINVGESENSLAVTVVCGSLTSDILITLEHSTPSFSGNISVEVGEVTDDYTADTIYKALTVKIGSTTVSPDLYTVELSEADIYGKSQIDITVKSNGRTITKQNVSVVKAKLTGVDLRVKSQYTLTDGRYKDADGNDAFVRGANPKSVFAHIDVVAIYANGKRTLDLTFDSQNMINGAATGERVNSNLTGSAGEVESITVTVEREGVSGAITSSPLTITFAQTEIIRIEKNDTALAQWNAGNGSVRQLYPYTSLNLADMEGNDGTKIFRLWRNDDTEELDLSKIKVDGSLAPDAVTAANGVNYDKTIRIVSVDNDSVSAEIEVQHINYVAPQTMRIEGDYATQIKHRKPDYSNLRLIFDYYNGYDWVGDASVLLTESNAKVVANGSEKFIILNNTTALSINVDYNGLTATKNGRITPVNDRVPLPMTDVSTVSYTEDCKKVFENFQSDKMKLEVYTDEACTEQANDKIYSIDGGTVNFYSGGNYYIKLSLINNGAGQISAYDVPPYEGLATLYPEGEFDLYYEGATTPTGISISGDKRSAVYAIRINKGTLAVNLVSDPDAEIHYGDSLANFITVTGTSNGRTSTLDDLKVDYKFVLIRDGQSFDYASCTYIDYTELDKINAGVYTVYAVTAENEAYLAGKVRENSGITITVLPKELNDASLASEEEYNRTAFGIEDFVDVSNFAYGETADEVLDSSDKVNSSGTTVTEFRYADTYTVKLKINENGEGDDYSHNYIWSDKSYSDKEIEITIKQKKFTGFYLNLSADEFYYGEATAPTPYYGGVDNAYFSVDWANPEYYDDKGAIISSPLNELPVGTYTVKYAVSAIYIGGEGNTNGVPNDFVLPSAEKPFTIIEAEIAPITVDVDEWTNGGEFTLGDYITAGYTKTLSGWLNGLEHGSADKTASDGLDISVVYTDLLGSAAVTSVPAVSGDKITFTDAGSYVVTLSLKDNYKWTVDQTDDEITFTIIINRAAIVDPVLSGNVTYNGTNQTASVTNWNDLKNIVTYTVTGTSLAADGETVTPSDGSFTVVRAGEYEVVFSLGDNFNNYGWGTNKDEDKYTLTFTVNQADLKVTWSPDTQDFDDSTDVQTIAAKATVSGIPDADRLEVTAFDIYTDATCTEKINPEDVTSAGTYYLRVTAFKVKDGVTDFSKDNYYLNYDETSLTLKYTINSQTLEIPVLINGEYPTATVNNGNNTITVIYKGTAYTITEFFENNAQYDLGSVKNGRLTIVGGASLKDVTTYAVTVQPAGNYTWKGRTGDAATAAITYTFKIDQFEIGFSWTKTEFTYNATAQTPTAEPQNIFDGDDVTVEVGVSKTDAGVYSIAFSDLSLGGAQANNYKLTTVTVNEKLTIKRAVVERPTANGTGIVFNEDVQTLAFTLPANTGVAGWSWNNVTVETTGNCSDDSYNYADGNFTFYHAGDYTVKFTLPGGNYCWYSTQQSSFAGGYSADYTYSLSVGRKQIEAPALGASRAIELGKFEEFAFSELTVNVNYAYGEYAGGSYTVDNSFNSDNLSRKVYFVRLTFAPDTAIHGFTPSNDDYIWIKNADDNDPANGDEASIKAWGYLNAENGDYGKIGDDGTHMYLCFVITQTQVSATFTFDGYTFGDNGWYKDGGEIKQGTTQFTGVENTFKILEGQKSGLITVTKSDVPESADYSVEVSFYTDSEGKYPVPASNIVNGLPWNYGTYYAKIEVEFADGSDYQDFSYTASFAVAQLRITIAWENKPTAVYNGEGQTRTASITNVRYSTAECADSEIPALTVNISCNIIGYNSTEKPVNVAYGENNEVTAYNLSVIGVAGNNYVVNNNVANRNSTFTIMPMALTVNAKEINYVYGDSLGLLTGFTSSNYADYYELADGTIFNNEYNCIYLNLVGTPDTYGLPEAGGTYTVEPALTKTYGNYTLSGSSAGTAFNVAQRAITVTFTGAVSQVYGEALKLNDANKYGITTSNGNAGIGEGRSAANVFTLYLDNSGNRVDDGNTTANATSYTLKLEILDSVNYVVNFTEATYTITEAEITATANGVEGVVYKAADYNYINDLITVSAVTKNSQPVSWHITAKAEGETEPAADAVWTDVTSETRKDAMTSSEYWIKATAPNHNEKLAGSVTIEIAKATVTVTLALEIYYGEANPADYDGNGSVFLGAASNLDKYTVSGLQGGEGISVISGNIVYKTDYTKGEPAGSYTVTVTDNKLVSDNYTIVTGNFTLTVKALPVTVEFVSADNTITAEYWSLVDSAFPYATYFTVSTTLKSTYDDSVDLEIFDNADYSKIFTIATDAISGDVSSMNAVGKYAVTLNAAGSNYNLGTLPEGLFIITDATFEVSTTVADIDNEYDETIQSLSGDITVTEVKNSQTVTVGYITSESTMADSDVLTATAVAVDDYSQITAPGFIDAGEYHVYFIVRAANHTPHIIHKIIKITSAENAFDQDFKFQGEKNGWTYGLYDATNADGYDTANNHKITAPEAKFTRIPGNDTDVNVINYYLFNGEKTSVSESELTNGYTDVDALFEAWHKAGNFKAGKYTLYYVIDGNSNYEKAEDYVYITVAKKTLTVTADDFEREYGYGVDEYTYKVSGYAFVMNSDGTKTAEDVTVFDGYTTISFASTYTVGNNVGSYVIAKSTGDEELENYILEYIDGALNIVPRKVTIVITAQQSSYAYYNDTDKAPKTLTYSVSSGTFFGDDVEGGSQTKTKVFTLKTTAYNATTTNDVGQYPIYAVFNTDKDYEHNYSITVANTGNALYSGDSFTPEGTLVNEKAGVYTITAARLNLRLSNIQWYDGTYHEYEAGAYPNIYDGRQKGIVATATDASLGKTFTAQYRKNGTGEYTSDLPVDVGTYDYVFISSDKNYSYDTSSLTTSFTIYPAAITVTYGTNTVNEGWSHSETYKNDEHVLVFSFGGLVTTDKIATNAPGIVTARPAAVANTNFGTGFNPFSTMAGVVDSDNGTFTLTARNAGKYTVTLTLDNSDLMKNYHFGTANDTRSITFTFTIDQAPLTVNAKNAEVEYGTVIPANGTKVNRFSGFSLTDEVLEKVNEEIFDGVKYFIIDNVTYSAIRNGVAYSANNTQSGYAYRITPAGAISYNYNLAYDNNGELTVTQRNITVKLKGIADGNTMAQADYNGSVQTVSSFNTANISRFLEYVNEYSGDSNSDDWYGGASKDENRFIELLGIEISISSNAVDAGSYDMTIRQTDSGADYHVTFINASSQKPQFRINKIKLTVQAVGKLANGATKFDITYGDTVDGYFDVRYSGFIPADGNATSILTSKYSGTLVYDAYTGGTAYSAWNRHAGSKFTVEPKGLTFVNYDVEWLTAEMTVVSRKITVSTDNRVYTERRNGDVIDYNNGISGINHIAPLTFRDVDGNHNNAGSYVNYTVSGNNLINTGNITVGAVASNTTFTLQYSQNGTTWSNTAPNTAGTYFVRITLSGNDFVLDTDNTKGTANNPVAQNTSVSATQAVFAYKVERQKLYIEFENKEFPEWNVGEHAGVQHISITDFVSAIMNADYVQRNDVDLPEGVKDGGGYYVIGENGLGLTVYPDGVGLYRTIVTIKASAQNNYEWDAGGSNVTLSFSVASMLLHITELDIADWTYLEYDEEVNGIVIKYDQPYDAGIVFAYQYWAYEGTIPQGVEAHKMFNTETLNSFEGTSQFKSDLPVNAGTYILRAQYTGNQFGTTRAYCLFRVTPKEVEAPAFDSTSERNVRYNEQSHNAVINYNSKAIDFGFTQTSNGNGVPMRTGDTITVTATNAATYTLSFTLTDTRNYVWANGVTAENGAVKLAWTISKATNNVVTVDELSREYGEEYETSASSTYAGEFTYKYAVLSGETAPAADSADWKLAKPENAGSYWVMAVCGGTDNFAESAGVGKLTITKATITATPEGNMTYGDGFDSAVKEIVYTGWKKGELTVTENGVVFAVQGYDGTGRLTVKDGGYVLTVTGNLAIGTYEDSDFGFDVDNYNIVIENGVFLVNKKAVEVTIDNLSSIYGEAFNPSDVSLTEDSLDKLVDVDKENAFEALAITPKILGSMDNGYYNANAYVIYSEGHENSENYVVTVRFGIYNVQKLDVYVTVEAGGGEYGNVTDASVTHTYTGDDIDVDEMFGNLAPQFGFLYSGTQNDGSIYSSAAKPAYAGNYTAVARIIGFANNFNLITDKGMPSVAFIVARKAINESEITVGELKYNGQEQSPVILDEKYSALYTSEQVAFTNVDSYTVKLTLKDANNYKWSSVEGNEYNLPFYIGRGDNNFVSDVVITGWSFGDSANTPVTETAFGNSSTYVYTYSTSKDGEYTRTVPTAAGTYWVKVTVPQSDNYNEKTSEPVQFTIGKKAIKAPELVAVTGGEDANTVYTGERLRAAVDGYDPSLMRIIYDGDLSSAGNVAVYAINAGVYNVYFALNDASNYMWEDGTSVSENNAVAVWTIARKQIEKPVMNTNIYIVNGRTLTFIPNGFDEYTMTIEGNTTSYGGVFKVTVGIKDTSNFEWVGGSVEDITFDWVVVGWDIVFIIVVSVLGIIAGIAAIGIGIQYGLHKRKLRAEAAREAAAEKAFHENVAEMAANEEAQSADAPPADGETEQNVNNDEGGDDNE